MHGSRATDWNLPTFLIGWTFKQKRAYRGYRRESFEQSQLFIVHPIEHRVIAISTASALNSRNDEHRLRWIDVCSVTHPFSFSMTRSVFELNERFTRGFSGKRFFTFCLQIRLTRGRKKRDKARRASVIYVKMNVSVKAYHKEWVWEREREREREREKLGVEESNLRRLVGNPIYI